MDVTYTDSDRVDVGVLRGFVLESDFGPSGRNDFELRLDAEGGVLLDGGALVYADGEEVGGIVDRVDTDSDEGALRYTGRTWHGILAGKVLCPDAGRDYLTVSGEANAVLASLISRMGLDATFSASPEASGVGISSYSFERYVDAYSGILAMLRASGAVLTLSFDGASMRCVAGASPVKDWAADCPDTDRAALSIGHAYRSVNHLVCLGSGELRDRVVRHWYADENGTVSRSQTLHGADEFAAVYDYSNADAEELDEKGPEKLADMQDADTVGATLSSDFADYRIGDIVPGVDVATGIEAYSSVAEKIVTVTEDRVSTEYKVGGAAKEASSSLSASSESSGGGVSYAAGRGITIESRTISAEVCREDLDATDAAAAEAAKAASNALASAAASVKGVKGASPISASVDGSMVATLSHAASGATAGTYGPAANLSPTFGDTVTIPPRISVNATGHVTRAEGRTMRIPSALATEGAAGLMSAADKAKLDGVAAGANAYAHPSHASHGEGLYLVSVDSLGHVSSAKKASKADVVALGIPPKDTTYSTMKGATASSKGAAGLVPAPEAGGQAKFLCGDGTWRIPASAAQSFLDAHPVGSVYEETSGKDPGAAYGGTWSRLPSMGSFKWERKA